MSERELDADVIVVGGGLAGSSAAIVLARAGLDVIVVERGDYCGAKNMTGGRLYGHSLEKIIPNFAEEAPIERVVKHERVSLMTSDGSLDIGYSSEKLSAEPAEASYTVRRAKFDKWLAEKAEEAGAEFITGILVDELIVEDGAVVGIRADGDELYANVVVLADGVNSLLAQQIGMKEELRPEQVAVGAKETIKLGEDVINERFGLKGNEGLCWLSCGDPTLNEFGGGFLYTNKDTVSIGVVATLSDIGYAGMSVPHMLDHFKEHPAIAPYIEGGKTIEYSGHLVPEDGIHMTPELYRDGVIICGDAAGFCINLGFTVRGMDFAIESGRLAAEAIIKARDVYGAYTKDTLSSYDIMLKESFVMQDMKEFKGFPTILSRREIFKDLPEMADEDARKLFTVSGKPSEGLIMEMLDNLAKRTSARELVDLITTILEAF